MNPTNTVFSCHTSEWSGESFTPSMIARCAQLAMLLEVSASPKPGNVDREHNYPDTCFEHFVASSVSVYPVLELAAKSTERIGLLLRSAVYESSTWQQGGNTHFGAFFYSWSLWQWLQANFKRTKRTGSLRKSRFPA
ncbi:triphosphoribosyl-dephospho-CoA synthase [Methanosarcina horonobensis]|uniref:triphosphoribosyl-dephospho-CoA synthase n=1 Tax=Methanosarcina horonobensis TaxID=418008 RepID=UPI000A60653F|nr:triphosphoribosyl-dephospho-CoA synthase [Methanosarcina horonobensis]